MVRLTGRWVAEVMGGVVRAGDAAREFTGVSIDTRTLAAGELYVAIAGQRFDGADFAAAAIAGGAGGVVIPAGRASAIRGTDSAVVIEVGDTLVALQALGHRVRRDSGTKIVAITGSAGKTTTKELAATFLAATYRVTRNRGNLNNHIGLPLSLIDLRQQPDIAVVELGMSHAGEISTLVRIAEPDVRVWTNVAAAHLEFFESLEAIADAKSEILELATPSTVLIANADDERVMARAPSFAGRVVTFGIERAADVQASMVVDRGIAGTAARVSTPSGVLNLETPLIGRGNLANVLAATAVAVEYKVPLDAVADRARQFRPVPHRGQVIRLSGITIIDDSYNANPTATEQALAVLAGERMASRRVAVIGEMLELGDQSRALHESVGRAVAASGIDMLLVVGGEPAAALARAAIGAGVPETSVRHFETSDEAADEAARVIRPGDVILIKGSRGIRTDRVVDRLRVEFA